MNRNTIDICPHCKFPIHGQIIRLYNRDSLVDEPIWQGCEECYKKQIEKLKKQFPNFDESKEIRERYSMNP